MMASGGSETPTRVRACSDTRPNAALRDEGGSSSGCHPMDTLAEINVSTRSSHKPGIESASKTTKLESALEVPESFGKVSKTRSNKVTA